MSSIAEFSNDPKFTIKAVSIQTGIRPVTLRAWERRHEVLDPQRGDNRYRLYSERDVAILRWLKNRIDSGISISVAVHEFKHMTGNNIWPDAVPTAPVMISKKPNRAPDTLVKPLYQALIRHDEASADSLMQEIQAEFDLYTLCVDILTPALKEIGEAWYRGEIRITTEHFASTYLRGKLLSILQSYPARRHTPYIMIGGAPTEQHEIGGLMMALLLRSEGYRVEYLGPDLPLEDLADYARYEKPTLIVLCASTEATALEMKHFDRMLSKLRPTPLFGYGGEAFNRKSNLREQIPGIFLGETIGEGLEEIKALLKTVEKTPSQKMAVPA